MEYKNIAIAGLGLIGGSLAKTIRRKYPDAVIYGIDQNQKTLKDAQNEGVINYIADNVSSVAGSADIIFLCAPIKVNLDMISELGKARKESNCDFPIITDTSSIKYSLCQKANEVGLSDVFIGGHPMAGTEKSGYDAGYDRLFENVYYIVSPLKDVSNDKIETLRTFLKGLDCLPIVTDAKEHDFSVSCVSHVPHIISAALVNLVKNNDDSKQTLKSIAAGGFKDITRISSSSPSMWTMISEANRDQILPVLDQYIDSLHDIREKINSSNEDQIYNFFSDARDYRDNLPVRSKGAIEDSYGLFCKIIDEEGEIAALATRLAAHHINIKNIGIVHNREYENGALNIEFYDEASYDYAVEILTKFKYTIYEKY